MICHICRTDLDPALSVAGIRLHPNCAPNDAITGDQLRDVIALLMTELGARPITTTKGDPL